MILRNCYFIYGDNELTIEIYLFYFLKFLYKL